MTGRTGSTGVSGAKSPGCSWRVPPATRSANDQKCSAARPCARRMRMVVRASSIQYQLPYRSHAVPRRCSSTGAMSPGGGGKTYSSASSRKLACAASHSRLVDTGSGASRPPSQSCWLRSICSLVPFTSISDIPQELPEPEPPWWEVLRVAQLPARRAGLPRSAGRRPVHSRP